MNEQLCKIVELTGTSSLSTEDAVKGALQRAAKTLRHLQWFEVTGVRGEVEGGQVKNWQVKLKVGFALEP